ncbi:hypothetical protein LLH03_11575 [bacterium]|nr:hypothetical protein [bacterium]
MADDRATVNLTGTPDELGRLWGEINGPDLRTHLDQFLQVALSEHGLDEEALIRRSGPYCDMVAEWAPHWLVEADAVARAAGLDLALHRAFMAGKYRGLLFCEECTSYAAVGSATLDGRPLLHKNRDNVLRRQAFYRKHTLGLRSEVLPFLGVGDTSDLGVMMMVNAAGLAGSADQAGEEPRPRYRGAMNPYGLRLIAETATTCDGALDLVRRMTEQGFYAGGKIRTRWTFADRLGTAMTVLNTHDEVTVEQRTEKGVVWTVRREGLAELFASHEGKLTPAVFNEASRLPGVCVPSNCSSLTVVIDPENPETFSCAWAALGPANRTAYFPMYMGQTETPLRYLDGSVYDYCRRPVSVQEAATLEQESESYRLQQEAAARKALASGDAARAQACLQAPSLQALESAKKRFG